MAGAGAGAGSEIMDKGGAGAEVGAEVGAENKYRIQINVIESTSLLEDYGFKFLKLLTETLTV